MRVSKRERERERDREKREREKREKERDRTLCSALGRSFFANRFFAVI